MRQWIVTLLLLLFVSNAMVAAHAATHVSADAGDCELCAAYTNPTPALSGHCPTLPAITAPAQSIEPPVVVPFSIEARGFHPRAPPGISLSR